MSDIISQYHDLLVANAAMAADSFEQLHRLQESRGLFFGTRPLCTVLRPRFLSPVQYRTLHDAVAALAPAFRAAYDRALADLAFLAQFRLRDWEIDLLKIDPGYPCPSPTSRLDAFFPDGGSLKFTELNSETPAGAGYTDSLADVFYGTTCFQEFLRKHHAVAVPCKPGVLHALLDSYHRWRGVRTEPPRIAILDWREVPTFSEFILFYDYFRSMGIEVRNIDPRDVVYENGQLMADDYHITLIYKRVLISELVERGGLDHPVIRAVRDGAVCMANSFRCKVLFKKASFAVLSDERNLELFAPNQQRAIADFVPWTRVVEERTTRLDGQTVDLVPFALANRERFVLKPNDDYGGHGIVLGWTVDQPTWEAAVRTALGSPHVIQEKVPLASEAYPSFVGGTVEIADRLQDTNPFVAFGDYMHGCLTRISTDPLVNVTAGGGSTVPTFVVERR